MRYKEIDPNLYSWKQKEKCSCCKYPGVIHLNKKNPAILIVDDDQQIRRILSVTLKSWNYDPLEAGTLSEAAAVLHSENPPVILLDIQLPDGSGLDYLSEIKNEHADAIVVMVTGNADVKSTIGAMRGGAYDFIEKPIRLEELRVTLRNALETRDLRRIARHSRLEREQEFSFAQIVGESDAIRQAKELAEKVAASSVGAVLLQGETGTGKDLFARAIHYASERANAPYLAINCAALPANLIESELFGYEKGAFTDAKQRKEGLFEQAHGGTIFLDEIGELELALQAKLLRVLEENTFRRVGGLKDIPLDARIIAASNKNLKEESEHGMFRLDLYFRLSVIRIDIPPLRLRDDDCLLLARYFIEKTNISRRGMPIKELTGEVARIFRSYNWVGNVRELRNVIERASILEDGELITTRYLPSDLLGETRYKTARGDSLFSLPSAGISLEDVENDFVRQAMDKSGGNITRAARLLKISRDQMRYRLKKAGEEILEDENEPVI